MIRFSCLTALFSLFAVALYGEAATYGVSGNPGAVNALTGTGKLGRILHIPESSGVRIGGLYICDYNTLLTGGKGSGNSLLILDLYIDLEKSIGWKGGSFGTEFLQFNGSPTNADAYVVQGYNSLPGAPPLNRSELYQLWLLQEFFDKKFTIRIGKTVPTYHFNNVSKPVPTDDPTVAIPSVSSLIYTPIFTNPTMLGVLGGYYNSVCGIVATIAPVKQAYVNMAVYDGNLARGVQTGLTGPHFNGYYFYIMETGYGWAGSRPGIAAIGGWYQTGLLKSAAQEQDGTGGIYAFGSQAIWIKKSKTASEGNLSGFWQFGWNNSRTLNMNLFVGAGLSVFSVITKRPNDSFGVGFSWSRLNPHKYSRYSEFMVQAYYQGQIYKSTYFQPVISYIPNPGANPMKSNAFAFTGRLTALF